MELFSFGGSKLRGVLWSLNIFFQPYLNQKKIHKEWQALSSREAEDHLSRAQCSLHGRNISSAGHGHGQGGQNKVCKGAGVQPCGAQSTGKQAMSFFRQGEWATSGIPGCTGEAGGASCSCQTLMLAHGDWWGTCEMHKGKELWGEGRTS